MLVSGVESLLVIIDHAGHRVGEEERGGVGPGRGVWCACAWSLGSAANIEGGSVWEWREGGRGGAGVVGGEGGGGGAGGGGGEGGGGGGGGGKCRV